MTGECGQALCNGLLIANVCQNGIKGRKFAAVAGGNMQAALGHQGQQTDGLQGDSLTTGVWAGDDHGVEILAQMDGNRHNHLGIDQRMPCFPQIHPALSVHNGRPGPHPVGKLCLGENHIQLHQHPEIQVDGLPISSRFAGKLRKDSLNFFLFLQFQFPQRIIRVDRGHRLHKIGGTGGGNVVDKSGNIIFMLTLNRHNVATLTDGNNRLPKVLGIGG